MALLKVRDGRLYRLSHGTFEDYCRDRWEMTDRRARQLMSAAEVVTNVNSGTMVPVTERQARPLTPLPAPVQREAWARAVESAPNGKPTARIVEAAVAEVTGRQAPSSGSSAWAWNRPPHREKRWINGARPRAIPQHRHPVQVGKPRRAPPP
jgi:hypothetical protein